MDQRNVYLFGSSFNPPTLAHKAIASYISTKYTRTTHKDKSPSDLSNDDDEIWILPVFKHIFSKDSKLIDYETRMKMARLAFADVPNVTVTYLERTVFNSTLRKRRKQEGNKFDLKSFRIGTIDVLQFLSEKYPEVKFHWIMGADNYKDFHKWKNPEAIKNLATIHVFNRDGTLDELKKADKMKDGVVFHQLPKMDPGISSTRARAEKKEEDIRQTVPKTVADFIVSNRLYSFHSS